MTSINKTNKSLANFIARKNILIFSAGLALLLAFFIREAFKQPFYWDTAGFLVPAALGIRKTGDILHYSEALTDYPHTFLLPLIISFISYLPVSFVVATHVFAYLVSFLFLIVVYQFVKLFGKKTGGIITTLFIVTNPLFLAQTALVYFEIPALLFRYSALFFLFADNYSIFLSMSVLAFLIRFENGLILFLSGAVYFFLSDRNKFKLRFLKFLLPLLTINILWYLIHYLRSGWWFYSPLRYFNEDLKRTVLDSLNYLFLWQGRYLFSATIVSGAFIFLLKKKELFFESVRKYQTQIITLFSMVAVNIVIVWRLGYFLPRYLIFLLPIFYLVTALLVEMLLANYHLLRLGLVFILFLVQIVNFSQSYSANWEDSLAVVDYIKVKEETADFLEESDGQIPIVAEFPEDGELTNPQLFGYEIKPLWVIPIDNFNPSAHRHYLIYFSPSYASPAMRDLKEKNESKLIKEFKKKSVKIQIYQAKVR